MRSTGTFVGVALGGLLALLYAQQSADKWESFMLRMRGLFRSWAES